MTALVEIRKDALVAFSKAPLALEGAPAQEKVPRNRLRTPTAFSSRYGNLMNLPKAPASTPRPMGGASGPAVGASRAPAAAITGAPRSQALALRDRSPSTGGGSSPGAAAGDAPARGGAVAARGSASPAAGPRTINANARTLGGDAGKAEKTGRLRGAAQRLTTPFSPRYGDIYNAGGPRTIRGHAQRTTPVGGTGKAGAIGAGSSASAASDPVHRITSLGDGPKATSVGGGHRPAIGGAPAGPPRPHARTPFALTDGGRGAAREAAAGRAARKLLAMAPEREAAQKKMAFNRQLANVSNRKTNAPSPAGGTIGTSAEGHRLAGAQQRADVWRNTLGNDRSAVASARRGAQRAARMKTAGKVAGGVAAGVGLLAGARGGKGLIGGFGAGRAAQQKAVARAATVRRAKIGAGVGAAGIGAGVYSQQQRPRY